MRFGLLGSLHVSRNGAEVAVRGGKPRVLLVTLLLDAGQLVPADRLVAALWDGAAPATARASLHNHVHALRRALGDADGHLIRTAVADYSIDVAQVDVDVQVFEDRLRRGRAAHRAGDWAVASAKLTAALELWRGDPLHDLRATALIADAAARWSEQRLQALEWRIDSDLRLGNHQDVVPELSELVAAHPFRENLAGLLMTACYRSGRQAEALEVYRRTRDVLIDELGAEPSTNLQALHQGILAGGSALLPVTASRRPSPGADARPSGARSAAASQCLGSFRPRCRISPGGQTR